MHCVYHHCYNDKLLHRLGNNDYIDNGTSSPLMVDTFNLLRLDCVAMLLCSFVANSVQVLSVSCGAEHTLALCKEGVYSWGSSSHGQVRLGCIQSTDCFNRVFDCSIRIYHC